jgi:DNA invertase Pin-like site-specific DNA recombinase
VHEVSRIGRNTLDALKTVEALCNYKVSLYIYQQHQETLDKNYKKTPYALIVLPLLAGLAEQWTIDHSFRVKSGLAQARKKGIKLGRPTDLPIKNEKKVFKFLNLVNSIRETERLAEVSRTTIIKVKRKFEEDLRFRQTSF